MIDRAAASRSLVSMLASSRISSSRSSGRLCASSTIRTVVSPSRVALLQERLELEEHRRSSTRLRLRREPEARGEHLDELVARQRRVVQVHAVHLRSGCRSIAARISVVLPEPASPMSSVMPFRLAIAVLEVAQRLAMRRPSAPGTGGSASGRTAAHESRRTARTSPQRTKV